MEYDDYELIDQNFDLFIQKGKEAFGLVESKEETTSEDNRG
ncbi:hypothetical protein NYE69_27265 [Paenibacillus sp. FSL R5-0527]